nr:ankyrin repeat-containing protein BDA1-like [Coffea arabica]
MESKKSVIDAAREGDTEILNKLLQENPSLLDDVAFGNPPESVLHVAIKGGHVRFVIELMKHNKKLAREFDRGGFRPLDVAAIMGNVKMVKQILRLDPGLCLLKGKGQRTALHYAASKGKVEVIDELLSSCPDCLKDVTFSQETALHLALKCYQFEAFKVLVKYLEIHMLHWIINWRDFNGNTVLHLAASTKQHECIEVLFSSRDIYATVKVNAKNFKGVTAADILDIVMESSDDFRSRQLILQHASGDHSTNSVSQAKHQPNRADYQSQPSKDWFKYFKFQVQRDSPSATRNALLVVAALIATVTFQAGVTPPSGVLDKPNQPNPDQNQAGLPSPPAYNPIAVSGLAAASAIFGSHATSYLFLFSNSLGLTASLSIIIYLTGGFPFQRELLISIFAIPRLIP